MWIVIEATAKYTFRGRTFGALDEVLVGCVVAVTDNTTGMLISSQVLLGITAEMIQAAW